MNLTEKTSAAQHKDTTMPISIRWSASGCYLSGYNFAYEITVVSMHSTLCSDGTTTLTTSDSDCLKLTIQFESIQQIKAAL